MLWNGYFLGGESRAWNEFEATQLPPPSIKLAHHITPLKMSFSKISLTAGSGVSHPMERRTSDCSRRPHQLRTATNNFQYRRRFRKLIHSWLLSRRRDGNNIFFLFWFYINTSKVVMVRAKAKNSYLPYKALQGRYEAFLNLSRSTVILFNCHIQIL